MQISLPIRKPSRETTTDIPLDESTGISGCQVTSQSQNPISNSNIRLNTHPPNPKKPTFHSPSNSNRIEKPQQRILELSPSTPIDWVPDNSEISLDLIEVVVMDEDMVNHNCDLMGKQGEQISPLSFKGSHIRFKVGYGNGQGCKGTSKGQPKRNGNKDKGVSQSMHSPKVVEFVGESTIESSKAMMSWKRLTTRPRTFINSSIVNMEPRQQKKQAENVNK